MSHRILAVSVALLTSIPTFAALPEWNITSDPNPNLLHSCTSSGVGSPQAKQVFDIVGPVVSDSGDLQVPGYIRVTQIDDLQDSANLNRDKASSFFPVTSIEKHPRVPSEVVFGFARKAAAFDRLVTLDEQLKPFLEAGSVVVNTADPSKSYVSLPFGKSFYISCREADELGSYSLASFEKITERSAKTARSQKSDLLSQIDSLIAGFKELNESVAENAVLVEKVLDKAEDNVDKQIEAAKGAEKIQEAVDEAVNRKLKADKDDKIDHE